MTTDRRLIHSINPDDDPSFRVPRPRRAATQSGRRYPGGGRQTLDKVCKQSGTRGDGDSRQLVPLHNEFEINAVSAQRVPWGEIPLRTRREGYVTTN